MIRSSALNEAELCGQVQVLAKKHPRTYRATLLGSAFHAVAGDMPDAKAKLERLAPDEQHELLQWQRPVDWAEDEPVVLRYEDAAVEKPVGLDVNGCYCEVLRDDAGEYVGAVDPATLNAVELLVPSTPDMAWVRDDHPRGGTVYVADIKTGEHPIPGGPLSLQFVAPALALADKHGADWIRTGIWWAREGRWEWGQPIAVDSELAVQLWQRIRRAATNPTTPVVGGHCTTCFQRAFCPAFMLPVSQAETELAALTQPGGLTADNVLRAHLVLSAMSKLVDVGKDTLKSWLRENGPVPAGEGKVLAIDHRAGREYADVAGLKAAGLTQYVKRSRPSEVVAVRKP